MANKLYNEHYTVVPTKHQISNEGATKKVNFEWLLNKKWNSIYVGGTESIPMKARVWSNSYTNIITGYTKIDENTTEEYKLQHQVGL
jgi:hypothetical protein